MIQLHHVVRRGKSAGAVLTPHRGKDGKLIIEPREGENPMRVDSEADALPHLMRGAKLRMSDPRNRRSPSLISFGKAA
jgi:hypothetical protein